MLQDISLIARQLQHETIQHNEAKQRLASSTLKGEQGTYASSTVYGQSLLKTNVTRVATRIKDRMHLLRRGSAAVDAVTVFKHLKMLTLMSWHLSL